MLSSEIRAEARKKLTGRWGKAALITLAYMAVFFVLGFIEGLLPRNVQWILSLITAVVEIPLAFGLIILFLRFYNEEEVKAFDFLNLGFNNFTKAWKVTLWVLVKMLVPVILIVVAMILLSYSAAGLAVSMYASGSANSGYGALAVIGFTLYFVGLIWAIVKSYSYQLAYLVAAENPDMLAKEAVEKSAELMQERKAKLFWLQLSFIGWAILCAFTFGIGMLWLLPYIQFAVMVFYKDALGNGKVESEVIKEQ